MFLLRVPTNSNTTATKFEVLFFQGRFPALITVKKMKSLIRLFSCLLMPLPAVIIAIFLASIFIDAYTAADAMNYHLPFSIRAFNLKPYPDYSGFKDSLYFGFPSFWRLALAPGLIFDSPRLFLIPNFVALAAFTGLCHRYLKLPIPLAAACCLVFPVAFYGFRSPLQDFFVNSLIASSMILLLYPLPGFRHIPHQLILTRELSGLALLAIAANVKFQGFFMAVILLSVWFFVRLRARGVSPSVFSEWRHASLRILVALALISIICFQPAYNIVRFGNPFYPIQVAGLKGDIPKTDSPIQYLPKIPVVFNFASFVVSSTEIDPIVRSQAGWHFQRSWHNFNTPKQQFYSKTANHPDVMTGGSNGLVFVALACGALFSCLQKNVGQQTTNSVLQVFQRRLIFVSVLFMFLPQVMELRYYMVIMFMIAAVSVSSTSVNLKKLMSWIVVAGLWFTLLSTYGPQLYYRARTGVWGTDRGWATPDPYAKVQPRLSCQTYLQRSESGERLIDILPISSPDFGDLLRCYLLKRRHP